MKMASENQIRLAVFLAKLEGGSLMRRRLERSRAPMSVGQKFPGWEVLRVDRHVGCPYEVYDVVIGVDRRMPFEFRAVSNGFHAWLMQRPITCGQWFRKIYLSTPKLLMP